MHNSRFSSSKSSYADLNEASSSSSSSSRQQQHSAGFGSSSIKSSSASIHNALDDKEWRSNNPSIQERITEMTSKVKNLFDMPDIEDNKAVSDDEDYGRVSSNAYHSNNNNNNNASSSSGYSDFKQPPKSSATSSGSPLPNKIEPIRTKSTATSRSKTSDNIAKLNIKFNTAAASGPSKKEADDDFGEFITHQTEPAAAAAAANDLLKLDDIFSAPSNSHTNSNNINNINVSKPAVSTAAAQKTNNNINSVDLFFSAPLPTTTTVNNNHNHIQANKASNSNINSNIDLFGPSPFTNTSSGNTNSNSLDLFQAFGGGGSAPLSSIPGSMTMPNLQIVSLIKLFSI